MLLAPKGVDGIQDREQSEEMDDERRLVGTTLSAIDTWHTREHVQLTSQPNHPTPPVTSPKTSLYFRDPTLTLALAIRKTTLSTTPMGIAQSFSS